MLEYWFAKKPSQPSDSDGDGTVSGNRRLRGRQLAQMRRERRRILGRPAVLAALEELDEQRLGRRRLASEERRYRRLLDELDSLPDHIEEIET